MNSDFMILQETDERAGGPWKRYAGRDW